jgi:cell division septum initiation protein DivIVA
MMGIFQGVTMRSRFLASVALLGLLAFSGTAFAGNKSSEEGGAAELVILDTKVPEVDSFYDKVEALIGQLQSARTDIDQANGKLAEVLGLATDAPVATALADLQAKAEGKIQLVLEGTKPTLKPSDAVPENVQAGIDAVNGMATKLVQAVETLKQVTSEVTPLATQAADMPDAITSSSLNLKDKAVATKNAAANLKVTKQIPVEAENLTTSCNDTLELIKTTFGG